MRALSLAALATALLLCSAAPALAQAPGPTYYLSLGDSLARGWQPDPAGIGRPGNEGYTDVLLESRRGRPGLRAVKLGCPGETSATMLAGGICPYRRGTQLRAAESFLRSHRGRVAFVTISIGGNDVQRCGALGTALAAGCAQLAFAGLDRTMPRIARRLRRAAAGAPVVGLTYYNAFLALHLRGASGQAQALATVPLVAQFNARLRRIYRANRIATADVPRAFSSNELASVEHVPGFGALPVAVARVCQWTWSCAPAPRGPDIHPNASGYRVIAEAVGRSLP